MTTTLQARINYMQGQHDIRQELIPLMSGDLPMLNDAMAASVIDTVSTLSVTGTTALTTTTYLTYGINVISTATISNFCARLPLIPTIGNNTIVINKSGMNIVIYPSVDGGKINGVLNGSFTIPSNNKPYIFYCYE